MSVRTAARSVAGDSLLVLASLLVAAPSLTYPFCRDQGLFAYVGRAWLHDGQVPYRDVFEQKSPLVFLVHGVLTVFSPNDVLPLRVTELLVVLGAGVLACIASTPPGERPRAGVLGLTVLAGTLFYFTALPFPDTGSCEVWGALALLGARAVIARSDARRALVSAGLLCGLAVLAKPPLVLLGLFVAAGPLRHAVGAAGRARVATIHLLAMALPVLAMALYFGAAGAWHDAYDVLVRCNAYYRTSESAANGTVDAAWATLQGTHVFSPVLPLVGCPTVALWVVARKLRDRELGWRYGEPLAFLVLGLAVVWSQERFFPYHYVPLLVGFLLASARLAEDAARLASRAGGLTPSTACIAIGTLVGATQIVAGGDNVSEWTRRAGAAAAFAAGRSTRDALDDSFDVPGFFDERDARGVARWLATNTAPDERVLVRGYEPEIYVMSGRRYGGRFFWSDWLTSPRRDYRRQEWQAQDARDFERIAPTWVVALPPVPEPWTWDWFRARAEVESAAWYEAHGYERCAQFGPYVVLRRHDSLKPI
jgi:hypothetical protein